MQGSGVVIHLPARPGCKCARGRTGDLGSARRPSCGPRICRLSPLPPARPSGQWTRPTHSAICRPTRCTRGATAGGVFCDEMFVVFYLARSDASEHLDRGVTTQLRPSENLPGRRPSPPGALRGRSAHQLLASPARLRTIGSIKQAAPLLRRTSCSAPRCCSRARATGS